MSFVTPCRRALQGNEALAGRLLMQLLLQYTRRLVKGEVLAYNRVKYVRVRECTLASILHLQNYKCETH